MKKLFAILAMLMLGMMAASAVTYTTITAATLVQNSYATAPGAWVTLQGNGSYDQILWPDGYDLVIGVNITGVQGTSTVRPVNITAGAGAAAFGTVGNLSVQFPSTTGSAVKWIGPLDRARFINETGYLRLSSYNVAGKVTALKIPRR